MKRSHIQFVGSLLFVCLLTGTACSREAKTPASMFSGVWIGWLLPQEPNTFDLTWNVWATKGIIITTATKGGGMRALAEVKFSVTKDTVDTDGKKGLVIQTDRGQWRIVFSKNGENLGVYDSIGKLIGGFKYVTDTHGFKPEDYRKK